MHLPDGFIDGKTAAASAAVSVLGVGWALRQVKATLSPSRIPLLGLAAAFLFAAQMVNFPVVGGTSGHLVGGVLVGALLGPSAAVVVVTTVLVVQAFLFADGGVLALGANIFNMGLVDVVCGCAIYRMVAAWLPGERGRVTAVAFAGWCATVLASITCAGQLAWSGTVPWGVGVRAMAGVHVLIGVGEGVISALVFSGIARARPDLLLEGGEERPARMSEFIGLGLVVVLGLAVFVAPFACPWPDGLQAVSARLGFAERSAPGWSMALAPEYQIPGLGRTVVATAVAGLLGTVVVFMLSWLLGRVLVPQRERGREF